MHAYPAILLIEKRYEGGNPADSFHKKAKSWESMSILPV